MAAPVQRPEEYLLNQVDVTTMSRTSHARIGHLYSVYFAELGLEFDPSKDGDFTTPEKYYSTPARGAYCVLGFVPQPTAAGDPRDATEEVPPIIVGCVGLRDVSDPARPDVLGSDCCELKRMFILPEHRGGGRGKLLLQWALGAARALGYRRMVLDTKRRLEAANALYGRAGFADCADYNGNPRADRFMAVDLRGAAAGGSFATLA